MTMPRSGLIQPLDVQARRLAVRGNEREGAVVRGDREPPTVRIDERQPRGERDLELHHGGSGLAGSPSGRQGSRERPQPEGRRERRRHPQPTPVRRGRGRFARILDGPARAGVQLEADIPDVTAALLRVALEAAPEHVSDRAGNGRGQRRPVRLARELSGQHFAHCLAGEELLTGEHLEQHDAEGPDVGALVDRLAAGLLGGHVGSGAEDQAGGGAGVREGGGL